MQETVSPLPQDETLTPKGVFERLSKLEPRPIQAFVPENGEEQKKLFMAGSIRNPIHIYDKLASLNPEATKAEIAALAAHFDVLLDETSTDYLAYSQYVTRALLGHDLLKAAQETHSEDKSVAEAARARYAEINEEMYGLPDEGTYRSLLREAVSSPSSGGANAVKAELRELLPELQGEGEYFVPSEETIKYMQGVAEYLYGDMVAHIPRDKESFSPVEIAEVFEDVIRSEFGQAAADWRVEVTKAASINVVAAEKVIKVPEDRTYATYEQLRGLVVHEIGVHMLRSLTGGDTDLAALSTGLSDYYDSEEGLGKVMEQAINGKYTVAGTDFYIAAGLMHFDKKDFRDTYEILWRIKLLKALDSGSQADDATKKAQEAAYKTVYRMTRGTDTELFLKDLAYYNGSTKVWEYAEEHKGDYENFMLLLLGKADPDNVTHRRILLETHSV